MPDVREKARQDGPETADQWARERQNAEREAAGDFTLDANGPPVAVPHEEDVVTASPDVEPTIEATTPTNWWRIGLIAFGIVVLLIIILQLATGGSVAPTETPDQTNAPAQSAPAETPSDVPAQAPADTPAETPSN